MEEVSKDCHHCPLASQGRTQVVFGDGNPNADVVFIGEGPGFYEDKQGKPFVGAAGKLLTQLLESIGLSREDVYITNVVKCRPPKNRDPKPEEIEACTSRYLYEQIKEIKPAVIATLGRFASAVILEIKDVSMGRVHGQKFKKDDYFVVPIYHPAAALHSRANLVPLQGDFERLKEYLEENKVESSEVAEVEAEQMGLF